MNNSPLSFGRYKKLLGKIFIPDNFARRRVCRRGRIWIKKPSWKYSRSLGSIYIKPLYNFKITSLICRKPDGTEILPAPYIPKSNNFVDTPV